MTRVESANPISWQAMYAGAPSSDAGEGSSWTGIDPVLDGWSCFNPAKDIVAAPWNVLKEGDGATETWARGKRQNIFFFAGDLGSPAGVKDSGPHGADLMRYSAGIRQRVARLALKKAGGVQGQGLVGEGGESGEGELKRRERRNRIREGFVVSGRRRDYVAQMKNATFCGVFPGNGWSGGLFSYVRHGGAEYKLHPVDP
jgi:hypothetical protein